MERLLKRCEKAVLKGEKEEATALASEALSEGIDPLLVIEKGFSTGIRRAGDLWERGEYFLPELAFSAEAMKAAMEVLKPALTPTKDSRRSKGRIVIGTVQGDIHDIGKTLVATMLAASGYEVIDLGSDVPHRAFIEEVTRKSAEVLCMSALLTTTMPGQGQVIRMLQSEGKRGEIKVVVGGAPTSRAWADEIGADGHADNAVAAVQVVDSLLGG